MVEKSENERAGRNIQHVLDVILSWRNPEILGRQIGCMIDARFKAPRKYDWVRELHQARVRIAPAVAKISGQAQGVDRGNRGTTESFQSDAPP